MRMPDVNVLIYAHREEDPDHPFYQNWLEDLINGPEPFALSPLVAVAFVRIVTHPSFSSSPTPLPQALSVIDSLRSSPHHRSPGPGPHHWDLKPRPQENASPMPSTPPSLSKTDALGSPVIPIFKNLHAGVFASKFLSPTRSQPHSSVRYFFWPLLSPAPSAGSTTCLLRNILRILLQGQR